MGPYLRVREKGHETLIEVETQIRLRAQETKNKRKFSGSGVKKASTGTSEESSMKNRKPHKIDRAYISHINYLKVTEQVPVIHFITTVKLPKCDSKRKTIRYSLFGNIKTLSEQGTLA